MTSPLQQKLKITGPVVVTANRLGDGAVVYRTLGGTWSTALVEAAVVDTVPAATAHHYVTGEPFYLRQQDRVIASGRPDEVFGRLCGAALFLCLFHRLVRIHLLVAQRDQGEHRVGDPGFLRGRRVAGAGRFPRRRDADLVLQLDDDAFGGLFADARDLS